MKKTTLLLFCTLFLNLLNSQTVAWSSDSEDLTGWSIQDLDADGFNWGVWTGGESLGFAPGNIFGSQSWDSNPPPNGTALSPDNILFSPTFLIPSTALSISFKMKVAASDPGFFAENFAVYIYDDAVAPSFDDLIHEETLTEGGNGTAKDITASIPIAFADKTVGLIIRHYNCTDQNILFVDDFEVSYSTTLSTQDNILNKIKIVAIHKSIGLYNLQDHTNYKILNMTGQEVLKGSANQGDHVIESSVLASGIYIVELSDKTNNSVFRKKVVLQ